ncbi:hypothetical protein [Undibacterium sp. YM2]|uniref:hypothetical protein n=1 Tax=Undibacterium sp. YM2 TaxID=2058625 RepID=UPI001389BD4D|nr:hypothetical protein [Undibacterium sp. YM2]
MTNTEQFTNDASKAVAPINGAIYVQTFTNSIGEQHHLFNPDSSKFILPSELAVLRRANAKYYKAIDNDRMVKEAAEKETNKPKELTGDEKAVQRYEAHKKSMSSLEAVVNAETVRQQAHQTYLESSPDVAKIHALSIENFVSELGHWMSRKYTPMLASLVDLGAGAYAIELHKKGYVVDVDAEGRAWEARCKAAKEQREAEEAAEKERLQRIADDLAMAALQEQEALKARIAARAN